jgi:hypothetical protein
MPRRLRPPRRRAALPRRRLARLMAAEGVEIVGELLGVGDEQLPRHVEPGTLPPTAEVGEAVEPPQRHHERLGPPEPPRRRRAEQALKVRLQRFEAPPLAAVDPDASGRGRSAGSAAALRRVNRRPAARALALTFVYRPLLFKVWSPP